MNGSRDIVSPVYTICAPLILAEKTIKETIESIKKQEYCGNIFVNIIDDGSTDGTLEVLKSMDLDCNIKVLELEHRGKADALNCGLQNVETNYTITVDGDTILHPLAVRNIMNKLVNSNKETAATAGCLFVKNGMVNITGNFTWNGTLLSY